LCRWKTGPTVNAFLTKDVSLKCEIVSLEDWPGIHAAHRRRYLPRTGQEAFSAASRIERARATLARLL